jgi:hypothetical protein
VVPSNATLTFEHTYTWWGNKRKLRVLAQPNVTLSWSDVPLHCRRARTILLGPLMPQDIDCKSFVHKSRGAPLSPHSPSSPGAVYLYYHLTQRGRAHELRNPRSQVQISCTKSFQSAPLLAAAAEFSCSCGICGRNPWKGVKTGQEFLEGHTSKNQTLSPLTACFTQVKLKLSLP